MAERVTRPGGVFRAVTTRDGNAVDRDGQRFVDARPLPEAKPTGDPLYEIQFEDGVWILARLTDLDLD